MNIKRLAAIALSYRDYPDFNSKLQEASRWLEHAAHIGSDIAVFPEAMNIYCGDGDGNPNSLTMDEAALDSLAPVAMLIDCAVKNSIAVVIPLIIREKEGLFNSFFVFSKKGDCLGHYRKMFPTPEEVKEGVKIAPPPDRLIEWEGLRIGGAICFDSMFEEVFATQAAIGADLFIMPSLTPGGDLLKSYALKYSTPIVMAYPAWSMIIDRDGLTKAATGYRSEALRFGFGSPIAAADINFDRQSFHHSGNQQKILDIERKYGTKVKIVSDQDNSLFYLESLSHEISVADIIAEFKILTYVQYMTECRSFYQGR
jgi:predicted amidohydrolase